MLLCKATGPPKAPAAIMPQPPPPQIAKAVQPPSPVEVSQQDEVMADLMLVSSAPVQAGVPAVSGTSPAVMPAVMVSSGSAQAAMPAASGTLPAAVPSAKPPAANRVQSKSNKMP